MAYVHPVDRGAGSATTKFVLHIHDPKSWKTISSQLAGFKSSHGFASEPQVTEIEIAFDCYIKHPNAVDALDGRAALENMTWRFFRFAKELCSNNARVASNKGNVRGPYALDPNILREKLRDGQNIYVGSKSELERQHIYLKTTDKGGQPLPKDEHRARTEVTFIGEKLPFSLFAEADAFKFETLSKWFQYRKLKPNLLLNVHQQLALMKTPAIGVRGERGRRLFRSDTIADDKLNKLARDALCGLTDRMNSVR